MPSIGVPELALVLVIILILFGPGKLPNVMKSLGDGFRQFKQAAKDASEDMADKPSSSESKS